MFICAELLQDVEIGEVIVVKYDANPNGLGAFLITMFICAFIYVLLCFVFGIFSNGKRNLTNGYFVINAIGQD